MVRIRRAFDEQLHALNERLVEMGAFVEAMVDNSIRALKEQDVVLAQEVIAADDTVDDMDLQIEQSCMTLLALQQPMARDLRTIGTIMKVIADVERIGDYAVDIARTAITLADSEFFKPLVDIPRMAELVAAMLRKVIQALVKRDLDLVTEVIAEDDEVDNMWYSLLDELTVMMQERSEIVPQAVALLLVARYLERIADHTVNVAERVAYMETGQLCDLAPSHRTKTESDS
ncbi:MAG: phosphate signaling complex protein PhoU [candidate division WS1 bacterium]|jgi:phosphate transport system protein|nr:phosphate signaling complex protein PhoU [candidate division WS1 bacterium]